MAAASAQEGRHRSRLIIPEPEDFDFWRTAYSHGWCDLPPFSFDLETKSLSRILAFEGSEPISCTMNGSNRTVTAELHSHSAIPAATRRAALNQIRSCLRLDEDFRPFLSTAARHPRFRWIAATRSGRMLRAPTVFEDIVRMMCTTNCSWALTRIMIGNLVRLAGRKYGEGQHAFPDPEAVAALSEHTLRAKVKAGYRAPYLLQFTRRVANGKLDVESFRSSPLSSEALLERLQEIKGIGPYAGQSLLKLLGRYDRLGLDSWSRGRFSALHCRGQRVKDETIEKHYRSYGQWRGLFFWLEMTRDWHDEPPAQTKKGAADTP